MALKHDWLDDGSLLILMPHSLLPAWRGTDDSHYRLACEGADDWLVPFELNGTRAFILGGDPGPALFVPFPGCGLGLIRWHHADDEDELIEFALRRESVSRTEPDLVFDNVERKWVLFNAARNPTTDRPAMRAAKMPVGKVVADTAFVDGKRNAAIVHRFQQAGDKRDSG
jgi:hypothetical protein